VEATAERKDTANRPNNNDDGGVGPSDTRHGRLRMWLCAICAYSDVRLQNKLSVIRKAYRVHYEAGVSVLCCSVYEALSKRKMVTRNWDASVKILATFCKVAFTSGFTRQDPKTP
jgi:hypothetical protein